MTIDGSGKYVIKGSEPSMDAHLPPRLSAQSPCQADDDETTTSIEVGAKTTSMQILTSPFSGWMFNVRLEGSKVKGSLIKKVGARGGVGRKCTTSIFGAALHGGSGDRSG